MKKEILIGLLFLSQTILAQIPISNTNNGMRTGDLLRKVEVGYVSAGSAGYNQVWSLGEITSDSKEFLQGILSGGDTVAVFEKGRILHYLTHGDTLYYKGYQQRNSYLLYGQERPFIRFPFAYGDSISGTYNGMGIDENVELSVSGWGYTVADGTGILTDGDNTIEQVTRIHAFDDYSENYGGQMVIQIRSDRYLWYCAGYRYPVIESIHRTIIEDGGAVTPLDSVTYLYLPVQQSDLNVDTPNASVLNQLYGIDAESHVPNGQTNGILSSVHASLSAGGNVLNVDYTLSAAGEIKIFAFDVMGNILGSSHHELKEAGECQESITLSRRPIANVLMMRIQSNEETKSIKVNY